MRSWNRLLRLSWGECWLLTQATVSLYACTVGLRAIGFNRSHALQAKIVGGTASTPPGEVALHRARLAARMVEAAADRLLIGATCLPRAMTLWWLLRRYGVETDLRIGVRKQGPAFQAHAWVEYGAVPLNDATNVTDRFAPFAGGILPRYN